MQNAIQINSDELVKFTNKLEKIGKYDLPVVARQTLNELAFRMKGYSGVRGEIDKEAENQFEYHRNKSLFRAFTGVQKVTGSNIASMSSRAGIIQRSGREQLAEGLAQQQEGGNVPTKSTPISQARIGKNVGKRVRKANYLNRLTPVDLRKNKGQRFVIRANQALKNSRAIMFRSRTGTEFVATLKSVNRTGGRMFNLNILFRLNQSGVNLEKKRPFVNGAAVNVMKKGDQIFIEKANERITKSWQKK